MSRKFVYVSCKEKYIAPSQYPIDSQPKKKKKKRENSNKIVNH
jgi:hypothetical protein